MPRDIPAPIDAEAEIERLARRYRSANGPGLKVLNMVGGRAESLLTRLPEEIRNGLDRAAETALETALRAAEASRGLVKDQPTWVNTLTATGMGVAGGVGGLPTALAELPLTTTFLLRTIQGIAADEGFDPAERNVQFDSIQVFAAGSPLGQNSGAETAFLSTRLSLTGSTVNSLITRIAPKLATAMGQKLAAQTIPVLGAAAGAATNYAYVHYYQQMARVHFGLRRLAIEVDCPEEELVEALRAQVTRKRIL